MSGAVGRDVTRPCPQATTRAKIARGIVEALRAPAVIAVQEVEKLPLLQAIAAETDRYAAETDRYAAGQGRENRPLGREMRIAELLSFVHRNGIDGLVWLTADVHCTAAHFYDPARAAIGEFTPFWEFVSGPLNAGTFGPNELDATFGPQMRFQQAPPMPDASPASGYQFFGEVAIEASGAMTVRLRDLAGRVLYSVDLGA